MVVLCNQLKFLGDDFSDKKMYAKVMPFLCVIKCKSEVVHIEKIKNDNKKVASIFELKYIDSIENNIVKLSDAKKISILKVEPINFNLKSKSEQRVILESYKVLLKQCDFDFQIYIQTQKANIEKHILEIKKCVKYEPKLQEMAEDYIKLVEEISNSKSSISRKFYIIFEEKEDDFRENIIIDSLKMCGNIVTKCERKEIFNLIKCCFKNQQSLGVASAS